MAAGFYCKIVTVYFYCNKSKKFLIHLHTEEILLSGSSLRVPIMVDENEELRRNSDKHVSGNPKVDCDHCSAGEVPLVDDSVKIYPPQIGFNS